MNYFDSAKNKALWEKELTSLRDERDRRKVEGYKPLQEKKAETGEKNPYRRRITLEELIEIERREAGRQKEANTAKPRRERNMEKGAPELEAPNTGARTARG
ncbi:MAG: hypothetical protein K6G16_11350 [Lachnospiraceae bacterium]|nr:hypothetical protein [Lachnospiraceae bacterium]